VLDRVADGVFDNAVISSLASEFLNDRRHHLIVAIHEGQVVGMITAVDYVHPDKAPQLWINEVGVAPPYQRQGTGKLVAGLHQIRCPIMTPTLRTRRQAST
jgi:aminoglycoside 6'-N-acetyltransferase I